LVPYLGMCEDAADGQLVLDGDGKFDLHWSPRASAKRIFELEHSIRAVSAALNGRYVSSPLWDWPGRELLTAHPLGGCAMAEDPARGVVNELGEVHGYPGLFIADASGDSHRPRADPSATISALAERTAFHLLHGRELHSDTDLAKLTRLSLNEQPINPCSRVGLAGHPQPRTLVFLYPGDIPTRSPTTARARRRR